MANIVLERIDELITAEGLSYRKFDERMGFTTNFIGRRIKNNMSFAVENLQQIYCEFDVSGDWLLGADVPMRRSETNKLVALEEPEPVYKGLSLFERSVLECLKKEEFQNEIISILSKKKPQ